MAECAQLLRTPAADWYGCLSESRVLLLSPGLGLCSGPYWVQLSRESLEGLAGPTAPTTVSRVLAGIAGVGIPTTQGDIRPQGALGFQGTPIAKEVVFHQWS